MSAVETYFEKLSWNWSSTNH